MNPSPWNVRTEANTTVIAKVGGVSFRNIGQLTYFAGQAPLS